MSGHESFAPFALSAVNPQSLPGEAVKRVLAFASTCFPVRAGMFSRFYGQVLLPTVMGCTTHNCELYDPQLWVVQPITVGSKTPAHDLENICWETGKHLLTNRKTSAHKPANMCLLKSREGRETALSPPHAPAKKCARHGGRTASFPYLCPWYYLKSPRNLSDLSGGGWGLLFILWLRRKRCTCASSAATSRPSG